MDKAKYTVLVCAAEKLFYSDSPTKVDGVNRTSRLSKPWEALMMGEKHLWFSPGAAAVQGDQKQL